MAFDRSCTITWYGHSCVEVRTADDKVIIFDPWFENPLSPRSPDDVDRCDLMLLSHGHDDHLGNALQVASRTRPDWPAIHELSLWLARNYAGKDKVIGMNKGGTVIAAGMKVTMTHADHSAGAWNAGGETTLYFGEPVGFVVELADGTRLYHAGDTNVFSDMNLIRDLYAPDLAMLPIGGHYTMGPREAALAVEYLGVKHVLPMHYGTYPILAGTPDELRAELSKRGLDDVEVHDVRPGESVQ